MKLYEIDSSGMPRTAVPPIARGGTLYDEQEESPTWRARYGKWIIVGLAALLLLALATIPARAEGQEKTSICHRTASDLNPYVLITIANPARLSAHIGPDAHPAKHGREDYIATGAEVEQGFCGEPQEGNVKYRIVRRMKLYKTFYIGRAGLGVAVTCEGGSFVVTFGGEDEVLVPVGEARRDTILRVRSEGIVLVRVHESEVC